MKNFLLDILSSLFKFLFAVYFIPLLFVLLIAILIVVLIICGCVILISPLVLLFLGINWLIELKDTWRIN